MTSVDQEGTRKGFDIELIRAVADAVPRAGDRQRRLWGRPSTCATSCAQGHADAVAMADVLHYRRISMAEIRAGARAAGIDVGGS